MRRCPCDLARASPAVAANIAANLSTGLLAPRQTASRKTWRAFISDNKQFWLLGAVLLAASTLADFVRARLFHAQTMLRELLYVNLEVRSHQPEYQIILEWLSKQSVSTTGHNIAFRTPAAGAGLTHEDRVDEASNAAARAVADLPADMLLRVKKEHAELLAFARRLLCRINGVEEEPVSVPQPAPPPPPSDQVESPSLGTAHVPSTALPASTAAGVYPFIPGYGTHRVQYRGRTVWFVRSIDDEKKTGPPSDDRSPDEVLTLTIMGHNRRLLEDLLLDARMTAMREHVHSTRVFVPRWSQWQLLCAKPKRYLDSLFLPDQTVKQLQAEVEGFLEQRDIYRALGLPWRRGYMFYGPPGTGKSSLILALAGEHNLPVYVLPLDRTLSDATFLGLVNKVPATALLVIEDLDASLAEIQRAPDRTLSHGEYSGGGSDAPLSLSGLLNALDGIASSDGRILVVTSNTPPNRMPEALLRPGRVDRVVEFGRMQREDLRKMLKHFSCPSSDIDRLATSSEPVYPAQVQAAIQLAGFRCSDVSKL